MARVSSGAVHPKWRPCEKLAVVNSIHMRAAVQRGMEYSGCGACVRVDPGRAERQAAVGSTNGGIEVVEWPYRRVTGRSGVCVATRDSLLTVRDQSISTRSGCRWARSQVCQKIGSRTLPDARRTVFGSPDSCAITCIRRHIGRPRCLRVCPMGLGFGLASLRDDAGTGVNRGLSANSPASVLLRRPTVGVPVRIVAKGLGSPPTIGSGPVCVGGRMARVCSHDADRSLEPGDYQSQPASAKATRDC